MSFFELVVRDHSKDHAVAVVYFNDTHTPEPYTTLLDSTDDCDVDSVDASQDPWPCGDRRWVCSATPVSRRRQLDRCSLALHAP